MAGINRPGNGRESLEGESKGEVLVEAGPDLGDRRLPALVLPDRTCLGRTDLASHRVRSGLGGQCVPFILAVFVCVLLHGFGHAARSEAAETLGASREASATRPEPCSSVLTLPAHARADEVADVLFSPQNYFPVLQGGKVVGVLSKSRLLRALANEHGDRLVAELMTGDSGPEPSFAYTRVEMRS